MTKIHMFKVVLLVRRKFKRCMSISNTPLGPSGRDLKRPSSRLGTLYSHYRQWVMKKKTYVLRQVMLCPTSIQALCVDFKHHIGPRWPWLKATIVKAGEICTAVVGNGSWQKSMYWAKFLLSGVNSSVVCRFQTPHWAPVVMVRSHHRRGWGLCTAIIGNGLWQKSMYLAWFCLSDFNSSIWGLISNTTLGPSGHGKKPPSSRLGTMYNYDRQWFMTKIHVFSLVLFVRRQFKHLGVDFKHHNGPQWS